MGLKVGDSIPLYFQCFDYDATKFVRALVKTPAGSSVSGSPVNLTNLGNGLYGAHSLTMPNQAFVYVQYLVYDDAGYTQLSTSEGGTSEVFELDTGGGGTVSQPVNSSMTGILESDIQNPINGLQDQIVRGEDRTLNFQIVRNDNKLPFDITQVENIVVAFLNADDTVTEISEDDVSGPITVTAGEAGQFTCVVTADQSALFMPGNPAPFIVKLEFAIGTTLCNFPYQLEVQDQAVALS